MATREPMAPPGPVREHISALLASGWTQGDIARAAGVGEATITRLMNRETRAVRPSTGRKITRVDGCSPRRDDSRPGWPSTRRIRSLRAAGFTITELVDGIGVSRATIGNLTAGRDTISPRVADRVAEFWDAHWADPVRPATIGTERHGWPTPMMWANIDDPDEEPIMGEATNTAHIKATREVREKAAKLLAGYGTYRCMAAQTGIAPHLLRHVLNGPRNTYLTADLEARIDDALKTAPTPIGWERRIAPAGLRTRVKVTEEHHALVDTARDLAGSREALAEASGVSTSVIKRLLARGLQTINRRDVAALRAYLKTVGGAAA